MDGEYAGNYLLCHEPHIGAEDLDIHNLQKANATFFDEAEYFETEKIKGYLYKENPPEISGGYLIEASPLFYKNKKCGFISDSGNAFSIKSPDNASREELEVIRDFTDSVENEIYENCFMGTVDDPIDKYSFARKYLIDEFFYNADADVARCFFYKKAKQEKMYAGPCWDYDKSCGQNGGEDRDYTETILNREVALNWDIKLMENGYYKDHARDTFENSYDVFGQLINEEIDDHYKRIKRSLIMDRLRWEGLESVQYDEIDDDIRYIRFFLYNRLQNLTERYAITDKEPPEPDIYNDCTHTLTFEYDNGESEQLIVKDGEQLRAIDMPVPETGSVGWEIESMQERLSYYIPIFEDMTLISAVPDNVE